MARRRALLALGLSAAAVGAAAAGREPVLAQVDLPHGYYWREMYVPQPTTGPSAAAFSPDGSELIYSMAGSLWLQPLDLRTGGGTARELTQGPGYDLQPDWSRDGRWVVFVRRRGDAMELWRLELASGKEQPLTNDGAVNLEPRISPDGRRLVFVSTRGTRHFDLWIADLTEQGLTNVRHLVPPRKSSIDRYYYSAFDHAINPSWSPDGKRVYYVGNPEVAWGSGDIWSIAVDDPSDRVRVLSEETTWAARPEVSPDGRRVLFSSYHGRQWHQLWLTTPAGAPPLPLTFGEFDRRNARWSPDGERVLYISNEGGNTALVVHEVFGARQVAIVPQQRAWRRPIGELVVRLRDESGRPLPGRVMVLAADERFYAPSNAWLHSDDGYDRARQSQENRYFHCSGDCTLTVPAGRVQVTVLRGLESVPSAQAVNVGTGTRELTLRLPSFALPASFGEHTSADLHVHMNYGGHYRQSLDGLAAQARAEDLDVVYNLVVNKEERIPDIAYFTPAVHRSGATTIYQAQEFHTSLWGHLGLLHLDALVLPDFVSYRHTALASPYPHNGVIAERARAVGALVGYVHPYDWRIDPARESSLTHALPADVAHGRVDYLEVVSFADHRSTAEVWHRLLNLGFRIAAGAGTDAMTNYASLRGPVGVNRVYLEVPRGERETGGHSAAALTRAVREGRGFVTNAPLLGLRVAGAGPGATVTVPQGKRGVRVEAAVRSIVPLTDIELVFNGRVLRRLPAHAGGRGADFASEVELPTSGWLLLRAWNAGAHPWVQDLYPYGTTNPVWVETGTPAPPATEDARYFVRWLDRVIEAAGARDDYNTPRERQLTLEYLEAARAVYQSKAEGGSERS